MALQTTAPTLFDLPKSYVTLHIIVGRWPPCPVLQQEARVFTPLSNGEGMGVGLLVSVPRPPTPHQQLLVASDDSTINQDTCSATNSASSEANSASNSASSEANSASSDNNNASNRKKRLSREELKTLIISICADWVSIEEIVERSGKSVSYIRNVVIPLLIAEKVIVMMYPGTPRNPNQKYRIKE